MTKCFKCEKEIGAAYIQEEPDPSTSWEAPCGGVSFEGGWNFGSALYDAMMDGIYVEVVICDDCLAAAKGSDRMREMQKVRTPTKSVPAPTPAQE